MPTRLLLSAAVLGLAAMLSAPAWAFAQNNSYYSGTTTSGMFGSNQLGGSASSRANNGNPSARGGAAGAAAGTGTGSQNVAQTARSMAPAVTLTQQPGAFVGADSADTGNLRSLQAPGANRNTNSGLAQLGNLFSQSQQQINSGNQSGQGQLKTQIRISLKLGFKPQPVSVGRAQEFENRLTLTPGIQSVGPVQVMLEGRTAVLRGKVLSEDDRQLIEDLARLEPEVLDVRNELVVDSSGTTGEELPPALAPGSR